MTTMRLITVAQARPSSSCVVAATAAAAFATTTRRRTRFHSCLYDRSHYHNHQYSHCFLGTTRAARPTTTASWFAASSCLLPQRSFGTTTTPTTKTTTFPTSRPPSSLSLVAKNDLEEDDNNHDNHNHNTNEGNAQKDTTTNAFNDNAFVSSHNNNRDDEYQLEYLPKEWLNVLVRPVDQDEAEENQVIRHRVQHWLEHVILGLGLCPFAEKPYRQTMADIAQMERDAEQILLAQEEEERRRQQQRTGAAKPQNKKKKKSKAKTKPTTKKIRRKPPLMVINVLRCKPKSRSSHEDDDDIDNNNNDDIHDNTLDLPYLMQWMAVELSRRAQQPGTTLVVCPECHADDFEKFLDVVQMVEDELLTPHYEGVLQIAPFHPQFQFEGSSTDDVDNWTNRSPYPIFHILREDEVESAVRGLDGDAGKVWKRNVNVLTAIEEQMGLHVLERLYQGDLTLYNKEQQQKKKAECTGPEQDVPHQEDEEDDDADEETRLQLATLLKQFRIQPFGATEAGNDTQDNDKEPKT